MKVLYISPDFNYACGRSHYIYSIIKNLKQFNIDAVLVTNRGDSLDRLTEINIPYVADEMFFKRNIFSMQKQVSALKELIKRENVDVIHTCQRFAEYIGRMAIKRIKERKINTVYTALSHFTNRYYIEFKSENIISVSKTITKNLVKKYNVNPERIHMIPNFVTDENIYCNKLPSKNNGIFNLLTIARFHNDKGINTLLKTMEILKDRNIHLNLIGDGELKNHITSEIIKHRLKITIIAPQKYLSEYYLLSDLCVLSSIIDPFPTFMLQAGLFKIPFIGSNISGINELIIDGVNGFLFTPDNSQELAEKIITLKNQPVVRESVSERLYQDIVKNYTNTVIMPKIVSIYKNPFNDVDETNKVNL